VMKLSGAISIEGSKIGGGDLRRDMWYWYSLIESDVSLRLRRGHLPAAFSCANSY
jgi:hypothetical protein